jgi:hypothetical protein
MSSSAPSDPQNPDTGPATPRNTGIDLPPADAGSSPNATDAGARSGERRSRQPRRHSKVPVEDTLLSVPAPAPTFEVEVEDRLSEHERQLEDLAARVRELEARRPAGAAVAGQPWLVWVVFLLALALAWQIFARSR